MLVKLELQLEDGFNCFSAQPNELLGAYFLFHFLDIKIFQIIFLFNNNNNNNLL